MQIHAVEDGLDPASDRRTRHRSARDGNYRPIGSGWADRRQHGRKAVARNPLLGRRHKTRQLRLPRRGGVNSVRAAPPSESGR